ncbi:dethiobiotin synthase [Sporosarcina obsidiansis]|uniref:dethiobiotin synthase n=1 Tax=Sporosarcina obsidiansis TaxID=2660748 RepID=UPI00129B8C1C|nr:dethiobiotin synthase [Sporosarcina obsidiansis]
MSVLFVTGTDTDVGKTIATTLIRSFLHDHGLHFIPFKPVQTGAILQNGDWIAPDVMTYQLALDVEMKQMKTEYLFEKPCSPHLAACLENVEIEPSRLTESVEQLENLHGGVVVEGAGGLYVPLTTNGYCLIDWMKELKAPVVLVARAGVGTINHTMLSIKALESKGIPIAGVLFNDLQQDPPEIVRNNIEMIRMLTDIPVIGTIPFQSNIRDTLTDPVKRKACYQHWNITILKEALTNESRSTVGEE